MNAQAGSRKTRPRQAGSRTQRASEKRPLTGRSAQQPKQGPRREDREGGISAVAPALHRERHYPPFDRQQGGRRNADPRRSSSCPEQQRGHDQNGAEKSRGET